MNKYDKIISSIKTSLAIEGLKPSNYAVSLLEQYANNKITAEEYIIKIKEKHNIRKE